MNRHDLPRGLSAWHPVCLTSTVFGCGLLPLAPGTWGSAAALPLAWLVRESYGIPGLVAVAAAAFLLGLWSATIYVRRSSEADPGAIVIDELTGQLLVLTIAPLQWGWFVTGLVLFRVFDIIKPWPASWAERRFKNGFGVMLDDIFAAAYAGAGLYALVVIFR